VTRAASTPLYFGPSDRSLFGWLHQPAIQPLHRLGVVLCSPIGQEDVNAHGTVRFIANALATAGFPSLRFDYDGCGDSAGHDRDPGRLAAWLASVSLAIDALKQVSRVDRVCLVGIRFGATLASLATASRHDVAGVIAIAPVTNGRALVRDWKAMGLVAGWRKRTTATPPPGNGASTSADGIEAAGFILTNETCNAIGKLSLTERTEFACPVFVIDRDDVSGSDRWTENLKAAGVSVQHVRLSGYLGMMSDPAFTKVPHEIVQQVLTWVASCALAPVASRPPLREAPEGTRPVGSSAVFTSTSNDASAIRETAIVREDNGAQFGILSEPHRADVSDDPAPAILLINSGAVRRIGPNRLYTTLARHFASAGYIVLRVDISGLGDSDAHAGQPEVAPYTNLASRDIEGWLAWLKDRRRISDSHLLGICSGAYHGFKAAVARMPLASVVLINPVTFFWHEGMPLDLPLPEHQVVRLAAGYRQAAMNPQKWRKLLAGEVDLPLAIKVVMRSAMRHTQFRTRSLRRLMRIPIKDDLVQELKAATDHSTQLEFVFSDGDPGMSILYEQGGSLVNSLQRTGKVSITRVAEADHTFSTEAARSSLCMVLWQCLRRHEHPRTTP